MPASIEERKRKYRRQAILGVSMFALLQLGCTVCFGALCFIPGLPRWAVILFVVLAAACAALMIPALAALKQRLTEIKGGELDEALKY